MKSRFRLLCPNSIHTNFVDTQKSAFYIKKMIKWYYEGFTWSVTFTKRKQNIFIFSIIILILIIIITIIIGLIFLGHSQHHSMHIAIWQNIRCQQFFFFTFPMWTHFKLKTCRDEYIGWHWEIILFHCFVKEILSCSLLMKQKSDIFYKLWH